MYIYIYMYMFIEREREREIQSISQVCEAHQPASTSPARVNMGQYIYIYIHIEREREGEICTMSRDVVGGDFRSSESTCPILKVTQAAKGSDRRTRFGGSNTSASRSTVSVLCRTLPNPGNHPGREARIRTFVPSPLLLKLVVKELFNSYVYCVVCFVCCVMSYLFSLSSSKRRRPYPVV